MLEGAKAVAQRADNAPSLYALMQILPFVGSLFATMNAENQLQMATSYVEKNDTEEASKRAWSVMAPRYRIPYALAILHPLLGLDLAPLVIVACHLSGRNFTKKEEGK